MKVVKTVFGLILILLFASAAPAQEIFDAVKANDLAKVKALVEKDSALVAMKDVAGNTPLHHAAIVGSAELALYLLTKGADIDAVNVQSYTPLHESIANGKEGVSRILIEKGCDLNRKDAFGYAPLHLAAERNCKSIVELLVEKGADLECESNNKTTPLHLAVIRTENYEMVDYLIKIGADVNTKTDSNNMPLNSASYFRSLRMIDLLMDNHADMDTSGSHGVNTLLNAAEKGAVRLFDLASEKIGNQYLENEQNRKTVMRLAISGGSIEIVNSLLAKGIQIDLTPDNRGWTPMHSVAGNNHPEMMKDLLQRGGDLNQRTKSGKSPYNIAEENGHREMCDLISRLGGDIESQKFPVLSEPYLGQAPPSYMLTEFAPDIVYTRHSAVCVSPDGREIYWGLNGLIYWTKIVGGRWIKPEAVPFSCEQTGEGYRDDNPFVTFDNSRLFFNSTRPLNAQTGKKENIWVVERTSMGWSDPKPVSDLINAMTIHWQMSVSNSGTLFFGGRKNTENGIYFSRFIDGAFTEPELLMIEGEKLEGICPYIAPDESVLIFAQIIQRQPAIVVSFKSKDGDWHAPVRLPLQPVGPEVMVTPDGKYLFNRSNWISAKIIEKLRPKK